MVFTVLPCSSTFFRNMFLIIWLVAFWTTGDRHVLLLVYFTSCTWWLKHIHQNNSLEPFRFFQNFQTSRVALSSSTFERSRRCFTIFCSPICSPFFSRPYFFKTNFRSPLFFPQAMFKKRLGSRPSGRCLFSNFRFHRKMCFPPKTPRRWQTKRGGVVSKKKSPLPTWRNEWSNLTIAY